MTQQKSTIEQITEESVEDQRRFFGRLKMVPLIVVYQLWVVAVFNALGWLAAVPACAVTGFWIMGWPKGLLKNLGLFFLFGLLLPLVIGTYGATN